MIRITCYFIELLTVVSFSKSSMCHCDLSWSSPLFFFLTLWLTAQNFACIYIMCMKDVQKNLIIMRNYLHLICSDQNSLGLKSDNVCFYLWCCAAFPPQRSILDLCGGLRSLQNPPPRWCLPASSPTLPWLAQLSLHGLWTGPQTCWSHSWRFYICCRLSLDLAPFRCYNVSLLHVLSSFMCQLLEVFPEHAIGNYMPSCL